MVNSVGMVRTDPFLSSDGLRLYLTANLTPGGFRLLLATRSSITADFGAPVLIPGIQDGSVDFTDAAPSRDELLLLYTVFVMGAANGDLWYARPSSVTADFGLPLQISSVNTTHSELDALLSADGCELYFSSNRKDGGYNLFHAEVTR